MRDAVQPPRRLRQSRALTTLPGRPKPSLQACHVAQFWIFAVVALVGCAPKSPVAPPVAAKPVGTVAQVLQQVMREQAAFESIHNEGQRSAKALGTLNGKLQSRGYFRRVPAQPAVESAEGQMRTLAVKKLVVLQQVVAAPVPDTPPPAPAVIGPGQRWQPTLDDLRGVVQLRIDLGGRPEDVAAFIDGLPSEVDRLIAVTKAEPIVGGTRLLAECYYERPLPQPEIKLQWPSLAERLAAVGLKDSDPAVLADPQFATLKTQVELGQNRVPDVRRVLTISADFARWLLRWQFFEERGRAEMAVTGRRVLGMAVR